MPFPAEKLGTRTSSLSRSSFLILVWDSIGVVNDTAVPRYSKVDGANCTACLLTS